MLTSGTVLIFTFLIHAVAACEWGKYGENCDKRCPPNCQVNQQRNLTHCNKETGECSDGCITGWYDPQCDQHCSKNCLDNVCNHGNGHCTRGCSGNQIGDFCEVTEVLTRTDVKATTDETTGLSTANVAVIITVSLVAIIVIIVVTVVIKRRRQRDNIRKSTGRPKADTDPENPEDLPLLRGGCALSSSNDETKDEYVGVKEKGLLEWEIQKTKELFEKTAIYNTVKGSLEHLRHVTISGASGEGKTSMALMLGSEYQKKGYELYFVDNISEFKSSVLRQGKDQCFIFDDIFGTVEISTDSSQLRRILDNLNSCLEQRACYVAETLQTNQRHTNLEEENRGNIVMIFTTKSYNLQQGVSHLGTRDYVFFKGTSVIDLSQTNCRYTMDEKKRIFLRHKHCNNDSDEFDLDNICGIDDTIFGFPLTSKLFFSFPQSHAQYEAFFKAPLAYLRRELGSLLRQRNNKSAALILMLLCEGNLNLSELEVKSNNQVLENHLSTVSGVVHGFNRSEVATCVRNFSGTYFTRGDITSFSHPAIYDACAFVYFQMSPAFVLKHCSIQFLYERVQAQTVPECETDDDRHVIYVSDAYNDIIASRLAGAVKQGNYRMSIMHRILKRQDILDKVLGKLKSFMSDTSLRDEHDNTIFHYACFSGNEYLVRNLIPFCDINNKGADGVTPIMIAVKLGLEGLLNLLVSKEADLTLTDDYNDTVLHLACRGGNRSIVEYLLPSFDINSRGRHGWTAVMIAAVCAKKDVFDLLVSKEADLTLTDDYNDTVLHLACRGGNTSIVEYLLPSFDINSRGRHGWTAVMIAALCAKKDVFDLLISKEADLTLTDDYNDTVLHLACRGGNRSIVEYLLPSFDINCRGRHGWTAVMSSAMCGKKDVFDLLVSKGADLTLTDDYKDTVLHLACRGGNRSIVEYLLPSFDINCRGQHGLTAVMGAAVCTKKDTFHLLVSKGADLTLTDDDKDTVLHLACQGGNRSIVEYLLPSFDINSRGQYDRTALMVAAMSAQKDVVDLLLSKGADLTLTDDDKDTVLHLACQGGNRSIVEYLLPSFDINCRGQYDRTALMVAAMSAQKDVVDLLVSKGADIALTDDDKNTVLHLACQDGNRSIVEYLLPSFDINCRGQHGLTAVMGAAVCTEKDTFDLLVSKGADLTLTDDDKDTVLHLACQGGNRSIVEYLLPSFDINCRGQYDRTALMVAAMSAQKDVVDLLVSKGADIALTDDDKNTVLHLACQGGNRSIVEYLLPSFDINCRGQHGLTAVMGAAVCTKKDTFDLLVSKGADLTLTDDDKDTVLHLACQGGNRSIVEYLLPSFDINSRGQNDRTALMVAAMSAQKDVVDLLLSKGADLTLTDDYTYTVLHLACQGGNRSIVEYLLQSFDINSRGQYDRTALMVAAMSAQKDVVDLLVSKGADLTLTDDDKNTVLHLACQGGNRSIVEYLLPSFDINSRGQYDRTALMVAAVCANKDVVDLLVAQGADLTLTDDYNNSVLHLACQGGNRSIVEYLLPSFDSNSRGVYGRTALMVTAECAKKDTFDLLVSKGADLTLTDDYTNTVLHLACQGGNRSIVEHLLPLFDINSRGVYGRTALMVTAECAKKDTFDLLVSKGADLTLTDDYTNTVLHLACQGGNRSIVEHLLPSFDINSRGQHGWTAVMRAAVYAKKDTFDLLLSKGADLTLTDDYKDTVLHLACRGGNILIVEHLLPMCDINCRGDMGWTPVMKGAYSGKRDTLDLLLSKGANPSLTGDDNCTLLHAASRGGNIDIVRHVIGDFDINTRGGNGHTPLMLAVGEGYTDVVDLLVDHGADVNMVDNDGDGLLHLACYFANLDMVKHVISYFDINLKDSFGWTPLAVAAVAGHYAVFRYLKGLGADVTLTDRAGDDVYTLALQGGCRGIIKQLGREEHSDKNITPWNKLMKSLVKSQMFYLKTYSQQSPELVQTDRFGDSLLHLACRGGNRQCVEYLLPSYDVNVRGRYNWTPVMMAAVCGHEDVFKLLVSHKADLSLLSNTGEGITTLARRGNSDDIVKYLLEKS